MKTEFIIIDDIAFESAVKDVLNLTDKDNLLIKDVEKIRKLDLSNLDIYSLKGIEKFKRLSSLDLSFNKIEDISLLKELKIDYLNLEEVGEIKDFSVLAKGNISKYIKKLNLSGNFIESFDFLSELPKLEILYLNKMGFDDFSELPSLEALKKLYLEDNELEDIEHPPYLPMIKEIYLSRNQLTYIEGIEKLKTLEKIRISYNQIETILPLKHFKKLKKLYMSYNQIVDLSPLKHVEITEKLSLDENFIAEVESIKHLIDSDLDIFGIESTGIIRPTNEQRNIINYDFSNNDILKANAYAGTGKTTTAIQFIENYKISNNKKILYLTFNKSVADDVLRKVPNEFNNIVDVKTAHSFAWGILKLGSANKYKPYNLTTTNIRDYLYFDMKDKKEALKKARLVEEFVKFYLNSDYSYQPKDIKTAFENFFIDDERLLSRNDVQIKDILIDTVKILTLLLEKHYRKELNHDFYLKLSHLILRNKINMLNNIYQLVIFDEAQDASLVMFDTVNKMSSKKLFIGDSHQEIYSFRYAVNLLNRIKVEPLELTYSFRFGKNIANLANKILSLKGIETNIKGKGDDKILFYEPKNGLIALKNKFTVISRTNVSLFTPAHMAYQEGKKLYFEGGLASYSFAKKRAKSIYYLFKKEYGKINDSFIKQFTNIWSLKNYSYEAQDFQLVKLISLIEEYGENFYKAFLDIKSKVVEEKYKADIIFTTTHKAKGVEYDNVMILEDFKVEPFKSNNDYEEVNMFYVAITRAKQKLYLPKSYEGFLDINIEKTIKVVNELKDKELDITKVNVNVDLYELTDFEKLLNKVYGLPVSNYASISSEKLEIAKRMINMPSFTLEQISGATGVDLETLKNLK